MVFNIGARQLIVAVSPQLAALSLGGCVSYPTILMQQLKANDSSIMIDMETASWIGSIYGLAGFPAIAMPLLMQWKGRKFSYIMACMFLVIGWTLSLIAIDTTWILLSESFHGLATNSLLPVSFLSMTEMIGLKHRFISMQVFGITFALGLAITGILGRFFSFRTLCAVMLVPVSIAVVIAFFWTESPPWFACRGEFDKCEEAFLKLRGKDDISKVQFKKFENKNVLLSSVCGAILCLAGACTVTYMQSVDLLRKDSLLCLYCLAGYTTCTGLGLNGVVFFISAEFMPVKHRSIGGALFIVFNCGLHASTLKISPYLLLYINMWGTFLVFMVNAIVWALFVWKYLPETKGRTLQEIEDFYMYGGFFIRNVEKDIPMEDDSLMSDAHEMKML